MKRVAFTFIIMIFFLGSYGQAGKVKGHIENSFTSIKKSWEAANNALAEIQKCNIATSVNEIQFIAAKARLKMEEAVLQAKNAEYEADGAEGEAQNIAREVAMKGAAKAEKNLKKAKNKFDDALTKLNNATDEDRIDYLIEHLNSSISVVEDGLGFLKKGVDELNKTLKEL